MIGPIGGVMSAFALGGAVTQPRQPDVLAQDNTLQSLQSGRDGVARIKAELTALRDALQSARAGADAVPGNTALTPVIAQIEVTQDRPTFVDVNGTPVQTGTITVSVGTRPVVIGYESGNRASLALRDDLNALASDVSRLVSTVGATGAGGFASDVSALLKSGELATAVNAPDAASIDAAIGKINDVLAKASGLGSSIASRASAAAQVDLSGVLLGATAAGATLSGK